jgi:hypothetical protein
MCMGGELCILVNSFCVKGSDLQCIDFFVVESGIQE